MPCKPIMVVEDDESIRRNVVKALRLEGYSVLEASNGRVALDILVGLKDCELPGCIILDIMMPEMDGVEFVHTIEREHPARLGTIKILVATAKGSPARPETVPTAIERIQKPMELSELYDKVRQHCGHPDDE